MLYDGKKKKMTFMGLESTPSAIQADVLDPLDHTAHLILRLASGWFLTDANGN